MLRMQINAWDYGGAREQWSLRAERQSHAEPPCESPNNQQQLPLLRQSSPGINKPAEFHSFWSCSLAFQPTAPRANEAAEPPVSFRDRQMSFTLTVDDQRVAQVPVPAHRLAAHAHGEDAGVLELHVADFQVVIGYLVTGGISLNGNPILVPEGIQEWKTV